MEICYEKRKIIINGYIYRSNITLYGEQLENDNKYKYIGGILNENGTHNKLY